jgi:hypothetical protein
MFLSKKHVHRRTVLKGVGASVALPLLDAMLPAASAWADTTAGKTVKRFAFVGFPHGAIMDRWSPKETGTNYTMSPILKPLEPFRKHLTIVSGLRNKPAETPEPHAYIEQGWLTCLKPWDFGKGDKDAGVSADQIAARYVGQETRLPSLELTAAQGSAKVAWRTPTQPLPQEGNPRAVFQKLFGQGDTDQERAQILAETGSILDRVQGEAKRLQSSLGVQDRHIVSDYLDSVREIERRVQMAEKASNTELVIPDAPIGTPNEITDYLKLMFDLMALAFQADVTRVITFQLARETSNRTYPEIGVPDPHHPLTHHGNDPAKIEKVAKINRFHVGLFAEFLAKLQATPEGNGTLLDHSLLMYGSGMGNPNQHDHDNLPILVAGGAAGRMRGGRHIRLARPTPLANLHLTLLDKVGVRLDSFADSRGKVDELFEPLGM